MLDDWEVLVDAVLLGIRLFLCELPGAVAVSVTTG